MIKNKKIFLIFLIFFILINQNSKSEDDYSIAYINDYEGECLIKRKSNEFFEQIYDIYLPLYEGDTLVTELGSTLEIIFDDASCVKLDPESKLVIMNLNREENKKNTLLSLLKGKIIAIIKKLTQEEEFLIKTKLATAAVKGTEFIIETGEEDKIGVFEGKVEISSFDIKGKELYKIVLDKDKETKIIKGLKSPEKPTNLSKNFIKRYNEVKDLRKKIEMIRELREKGDIKKYKLKRRLQRIENLKYMSENSEKFKNLTSEQKNLLDKIISMEPYYRKQLEDIERKEKRRVKINKLLEKKEGEK